MLKTTLPALAALTLAALTALGRPPDPPVVYNHLQGDGGLALDRSIKESYSQRYRVIDTSRDDGYVEPAPLEGALPTTAPDGAGQLIAGYVLVAYIVTSGGLVSDPVVLKTSDPRLSRTALEAMTHWRFTPGNLKGVAVATTAAQEFNFGPMEISNGYKMERVAAYQPNELLVQRMPPAATVSSYLGKLRAVVHNYFVGAATPEILHVVVVIRPGARSKVWLVSSQRSGNSRDLVPLRRLLEAVPPLEVSGGPVVLALSGRIAGGDGRESLQGDAYQKPLPVEWLDLEKTLKEPLPLASDAFLDQLWPDAK